ncbi:zona pellucida sperm-binding protein 3-like [Pelodytes ibericus]
MVQWGTVSWWLLAVLVFGPDLAASSHNVQARNRRQGDPWWRVNHPVSGWGASRQVFMPTAPPAALTAKNPIRVQCMEDSMVVSVHRDLYGNGRLVKASDLSLGPSLCKPSSQSTDTTVIFQNALQDCGSRLQMTPDWLIYSINLTYRPTTAMNSPIIRSNPAVVPIQCYYYRFHNVSSNAIKPTWLPFQTTISAEERLSFSLRLMNADWSAPRASNVFQLGDIFNIQASVEIGNHVPMMILVDSCVATLSPDVKSNPSYDIIALNGCLMDGKQEDASSAFISPRPGPDQLQFTVDAFRFTGTDASMIFITCNLRAVAINQVPDPMNKACSFSKSTNSWSPLEGSRDICRCCDSGSCALPLGQGSRSNTWSGGRGRREAETGPAAEQDHTSATLGPLLVIGADQKQALAVTQAPEDLELWVLVAVVSLSLVVLVVSTVFAGKLMIKKCKK